LIAVFFTAIALAIDASAVSICLSLNYNKKLIYLSLRLALWFGFFQGFMTLFGYFVSSNLLSFLVAYGNYLAFSILFMLGIKMLFEIKKEKLCAIKNSKIIVLAFLTSIDALAIGIAYSFTAINIYIASFMIGLVTFILSFIFSYFSIFINCKYLKYFELLGGLSLIFIAVIKLF